MDEVGTYLTELNIRNSSFVKLIGCPLPSHHKSLSSVFEKAGVRGIRALSVSMIHRSRGGTVLEGEHLTGLSGLYHLDLANNGIKQVNKNFFKDFPRLKVLDLSSNEGIVFEEGSLDNLTTLEELKLSSCGIQTIPEDFFGNLSNLKILNLHGNRISEFSAKVFSSQRSLKNLVLTRNLLTNFPGGIFDNLTALTKIDLGYNRFKMFPEKLFYKNLNLKFFSIILNGACPSIHPQCKEAITKLKLPENLFFNSSMEEIKIVASPIHEIHPYFLAGFNNLTKLTLKESMVKVLPKSLFQDAKNLKYLDLSGNLLTNLPENIFLGLQKLEEINLSQNLVTTGDTECIKANILQKLTTLNLAHNQITSIDQDILILSDLQTLNLSHNHIGDIKPIDINFQPPLSNRILEVEIKQDRGLLVDLSFNRIERFILKNGFNISGPNFKLNLEGNPLICDCFITELKQKLEGKLERSNLYSDMFTLTSHSLLCGQKSFPKNSGKYLQNVKFDDLLCPFPSASMPYDCTGHCSCFLDRFHRETVMNCSSQNLTTFPQTLVLIEGESDSIQLHLENNSLTNIIEGTKVDLFQNISQLFLSNNRIECINKEVIPENLKQLSLDNNRIEKIEEEDLEYLDGVISRYGLQLSLGKNPFHCSCDSRDLFHFVQNRKDIILDRNNITLKCEEEDIEVLHSDLHDFCIASLSPVLILIVIIIVIILVLVCIVLVIYSCHKETIKIWIYSKSWARIFFTEDLIDKDKPYDAFISYSHLDAEFVEKVLLPGLETPGGGSDPYKCLIHTRDWNIGQMIPDQIITSVETSRRTIIVLSQAYIEAMWTKLEFRAAHTQALQDKTKRVILITVGELPSGDNLDTDLQKYISLNTYLDSKDPWFWQKLRYAMPHRGNLWKKKRNRRVTDKIELIRSMASVEMGKESSTPSPSCEDMRNKFTQDLILQMNKDDILKESGAVVRNNPHLNIKDESASKESFDVDNPYQVV